MRSHTFIRPLAVAALLACSPAVATAQPGIYADFSAGPGGFTSVDLGFGGLWVHAASPDAPPVQGVSTAWAIPGGTPGAFALQSPAAALTVTVPGPVTGFFTHRFSFGAEPDGEDSIAHDGGIIQYRVGGSGPWLNVSETLVGYTGVIAPLCPPANTNPLEGNFAFTKKSDGYDGLSYDTTAFSLRELDFEEGDVIEIRFVAGFTGDEFSNPDVNWQLGSVFLHDASPVPEPAGVLGLAALAAGGYHLRRRVTSPPDSCRTPAS